MTDRDASAREELHRKLAQSREEVSRLLDPPRASPPTNGQDGAPGHRGFPRSRTMNLLLSSRGLGAMGALAAGLLIARPALALRLLKVLPVSALAKNLIARVMSTLKTPDDAGT